MEALIGAILGSGVIAALVTTLAARALRRAEAGNLEAKLRASLMEELDQRYAERDTLRQEIDRLRADMESSRAKRDREINDLQLALIRKDAEIRNLEAQLVDVQRRLKECEERHHGTQP